MVFEVLALFTVLHYQCQHLLRILRSIDLIVRRKIQHPLLDSVYVAYFATQHRVLMTMHIVLRVAGIVFEMLFQILRNLLHQHPLQIVVKRNSVLEEPEDELHFLVGAETFALALAFALQGVILREIGRDIKQMLQLKASTSILLKLSDKGHALLHRFLNGIDGPADSLLKNIHAHAMQLPEVIAVLHNLLKWPPSLNIFVVSQK